MISCKDIAQEAHDLLDGEVGFIRRVQIRYHLLICKYCRRYLRQLSLTLRTLREGEVLQIPDEPSEAEIDEIVAKIKQAEL